MFHTGNILTIFDYLFQLLLSFPLIGMKEAMASQTKGPIVQVRSGARNFPTGGGSSDEGAKI